MRVGERDGDRGRIYIRKRRGRAVSSDNANEKTDEAMKQEKGEKEKGEEGREKKRGKKGKEQGGRAGICMRIDASSPSRAPCKSQATETA
jgi:hypothetical protein